MSPRFKLPTLGIVIVVGRHFGTIPLFFEGGQPLTKFSRLGRCYPTGFEVHNTIAQERNKHAAFVGNRLRLFGQLDSAATVDSSNSSEHDIRPLLQSYCAAAGRATAINKILFKFAVPSSMFKTDLSYPNFEL
jgi:hypothetical protein